MRLVIKSHVDCIRTVDFFNRKSKVLRQLSCFVAVSNFKDEAAHKTVLSLIHQRLDSENTFAGRASFSCSANVLLFSTSLQNAAVGSCLRKQIAVVCSVCSQSCDVLVKASTLQKLHAAIKLCACR